MKRAWCIRIVTAGVLASAGAACVVNEPETPTRGVVVSGPPPAPLAEQPPPPPGPTAAWIRGYWHWTGMQYAWIPGHWESPPAGAVWRAPAYSQKDGRYVYESGGWNAAPVDARAGTARALR